jgi:hypothetical protein
MLPYHFETLKKISTEIYSEGKNLAEIFSDYVASIKDAEPKKWRN